MRIDEVLAAKRFGGALSRDQIEFFTQGVTDGSVSDAQIAAFTMAVAIHGMEPFETAALTGAMARSGGQFSWPHLPGPVVDKHSSGGIGDKVSLVLAPVLAACGAFVPMISGRGLGHTGGTLDKLESLDGYRAEVAPERFRACVEEVGCAIVGATQALAPADGRIYAVRDLTATVDSLPLITASILSKKLAAGPQSLVMDIKCGNGAFCTDLPSARALAQSIVSVANASGLRTTAIVTDMSMCLGRNAGNALEVAEALSMLKGEVVEPRLKAVVMALGIEALLLAGLVSEADEAASRIETVLTNGEAFERFSKMMVALGGDRSLALPRAPIVREVWMPGGGRIAGVDAKKLGLAVIELGGGRVKAREPIDHAVGFSDLLMAGEDAGERPLALVHARCEADAERAVGRLCEAYRIGEASPLPIVRERIAT